MLFKDLVHGELVVCVNHLLPDNWYGDAHNNLESYVMTERYHHESLLENPTRSSPPHLLGVDMVGVHL